MSTADELNRLAALQERGLLTAEEFEQEKAAILGASVVESRPRRQPRLALRLSIALCLVAIATVATLLSVHPGSSGPVIGVSTSTSLSGGIGSRPGQAGGNANSALSSGQGPTGAATGPGEPAATVAPTTTAASTTAATTPTTSVTTTTTTTTSTTTTNSPSTTTSAGGTGAGTPTSAAGSVSYDVRADIDGHSQLIISGTSAYWHNIDFAAPGRASGQNQPTVINGASWYPTWPQSGDNRCNCDSGTFNGITPPVPASTSSYTWKGIACRDSCSASYQGGTLTLDFNDDATAGDTWYELQVTLSS